MRTAAGAIGWEFRRQHRWGWMAIAAYMVVLASIRLWMLVSGHSVSIDDDESFGLFVMFPLAASFFYAVTVFTFGLSGDLAARESMYPPRLLRLPVSTSALAGLPMLYGGATVVVIWAVLRILAIYPPNIPIPRIWPAFLGVAILAWAQALTWMPYGMRGVRVVTSVLWLVSIDAVVILALALEAPEWGLSVFLAVQIPLAYVVARAAVARARRGHVPEWKLGWETGADARADALRPFASAAQAQLWFEWRRCGLGLPILVLFVVPVELALFFVAGNTVGLVFFLIVAVLITPPFLARAAGATVRRSSPQSNDSHGLPAFMITRPMTSAGLVGATLKVTVISTIVTWAFVGIALPVALLLSGAWPLVTDRVARLAGGIGAPRVVVAGLILLAVLLLSTWRQLVQSLYIGLTGREWLVKTSVFAMLFVVLLLLPAIKWVAGTPRALGLLWGAIPIALAVAVVLKLAAAIMAIRGLDRRHVLADRTLLRVGAGWTAAVLALYGALVWFFGMPYLPRYILAMLAIVTVPLARVAAAPLAFDWNRHR